MRKRRHGHKDRVWDRKQGYTSCQVSAPALSLMISKSFCVSESLKLELLRVEARVLNGNSRGTSATSTAATAERKKNRAEKLNTWHQHGIIHCSGNQT